MELKAKELNPIHSLLLLDFNTDPKVAGHYRPVGTDDHLSQFKFLLPGFEHGGIYETNVRDAPEFLVVIIHRFLCFYT